MDNAFPTKLEFQLPEKEQRQLKQCAKKKKIFQQTIDAKFSMEPKLGTLIIIIRATRKDDGRRSCPTLLSNPRQEQPEEETG